MSLFNTQKKAAGNKTAGETKISKPVAVKKAVKAPKTTEVAKVAPKKSTSEKRAEAAQGVVFPKGSAVIKPRVTEKAGLLSQQGVYAFDVRIDANVKQIAAAIKDAYKVTPVKVNVSSVKSKAMFARGRRGSTSMGKKAYVFLKKGDTIEFI